MELSWAGLLEPGKASIVKRGVRRTVYRVDVAENSYFVKHYRCPHWLLGLQNMLRRSASRREWVKSLELQRRKIPTAQPVALGEARQATGLVGDNFFVTAGIPNARPLAEFLSEVLPQRSADEQATARRQLAIKLADLLAKAHRQGVWHDDLHAGNVLVSLVENKLELYLIDLPGTRLLGRASWARSRASLVMFHAGLVQLDWRFRWRFWRRYCQARADLGLWKQRRAAAAEISARTWPYLRSVIRGRDKRCLRENRDFHHLQTPQGSLFATVDFHTAQLQQILANPDAIVQRFQHWPAKISHSSVVVRAALGVGEQPMMVAFKRSRARRGIKRLLRWRTSRALHNWRTANALLQRGIPTARPLLMCESATGKSYLATQWVEGAENLHLFGWQMREWEEPARRRGARHLATSLGKLVSRLHAWNFAHRDLKACNLVVVRPPASTGDCPDSPDDFELMMIDLDGVRLKWYLTERTRIANLARLALSAQLHPWLSRTFFLRVLHTYLSELPPNTGGIPQRPDKATWKKLWRKIASHHNSLLAEKQRRGRIVA